MGVKSAMGVIFSQILALRMLVCCVYGRHAGPLEHFNDDTVCDRATKPAVGVMN